MLKYARKKLINGLTTIFKYSIAFYYETLQCDTMTCFMST